MEEEISPCLKCPRRKESKHECSNNCKKLKQYQEAHSRSLGNKYYDIGDEFSLNLSREKKSKIP